MPILSGSLSCRCFRVRGKPPINYRETWPRQIQRNAYRPPRTDRGEMRSYGWVNPRRILETKFDLDEVIVGERLVLVIRLDSISLNSRLYKARLAEEIVRVGKETRRERLGRDEKRILEEKVQLEMAKTQTPSTAFQEMAWNLKTGLTVFTATGEKACLQFQELFTETFDLAIEPLLPYTRAAAAAKKLSLEGELEEALPAIFSPKGERVAMAEGE
ncbi:MAG: hypothetical protein NTW86_11760 [Candidatus Sumerlaeota bacterium]|nr:hypothetical protein [Candidatus Sumerlaeota bacterium]